jgi:hypothetical protein
MSGCRAGAVLDGPSLCPHPVLSADDATALGLTPKWCAAHAEPLARVRASLLGRKLRATAVRKPQPAPAKPPTPDAIGRLPVAVRALALARFVHANPPRVSRADGAQSAGVSATGGFHRILGYAKRAGWVRTRQGSPGGLQAGPVAPPAD